MTKADFKVSYTFRKAGKGKPGLVYIKSKQNSDKQFVYNTGVRLLMEQWDKKKARPKSLPSKLIELEAKIRTTYTSLFNDGYIPTLQMVLDHQNDRKGFLEAWFDALPNWQFAASQFAAAQGRGDPWRHPSG